MPGVNYGSSSGQGGGYQPSNYIGGRLPGLGNYEQLQNQGAYWDQLSEQYGNMSSIPMVGRGGQQYEWAYDPNSGQMRPVEYTPQQNQWEMGGGMPGGGPQYQDWGGMSERPEYQMPGSYAGTGAGWQDVNPYQTGTYQPGSQWGQGQYGMGSGVMQQGFQGYAPDSSLDPQRVIDASVAPLQHERDVGFAEAASRAGQSGFAMSTPYMEQLGQVEQRSLQDLDKTTQQYLYNAAQFKAQQDMQAQQSALDRSLSSYGTHSGYGHSGQMRDLSAADQAAAQSQALNAQGQLQDLGQDFNAWQQQGTWQMDANRSDQDAWRTENQYGQDAWRFGNQYANQDYWNAVNQWGTPGIVGQVMGGASPYGPAFNGSSSYAQNYAPPQMPAGQTQSQVGY